MFTAQSTRVRSFAAVTDRCKGTRRPACGLREQFDVGHTGNCKDDYTLRTGSQSIQLNLCESLFNDLHVHMIIDMLCHSKGGPPRLQRNARASSQEPKICPSKNITNSLPRRRITHVSYAHCSRSFLLEPTPNDRTHAPRPQRTGYQILLGRRLQHRTPKLCRKRRRRRNNMVQRRGRRGAHAIFP